MQSEQKNNKRETLHILVFSVSLRNDSLNTRLAKLSVHEESMGRIFGRENGCCYREG
jgi:hypothetical protein